MAKRQHLIHLHSTSKTGTIAGFTSANLQVGELAMYNPAAASATTIYAFNANKDALAEFKTDAYYQNEFKKFAASGHTSASATTTTIGHVKLVGGDLSGRTGSTVTTGEAAASQHTHSQYSLTTHNHDGKYAPISHSHGTIKLTGGATGEANFTNTGASISVTITNDSHTHKSSGITDSISASSAITSSATGLVQGKAVYNYVDSKFAANDAMLYKGAITAASGIPSTFQAGWTYKVATAGTYFGQKLEVGDMIIAVKDATSVTITTSNFAEYWNAIQTNTDGHVSGPASAVSGNVAIFDGTTGKLIKDSGFTIAKSVPSGASFTDSATTQAGHYTPGTGTTVKTMATQEGVSGGKVTIPSLQFDNKGHYVATTATTVITLPTDTHHTAKNIVGASSSATADATATNGNVWLNLIENGAVRSNHNIKGSGATTVTASADGDITITSTDSATTLDGHYTPSGTGTVISGSNKTLTWSGNFIIPTVEYDSKGHIIKSGSTTVTMPGNPNTDYQVKSSTGTSKYYLVGSTGSGTTTGETYKHVSVYAQNGVLYSENTKVVNTSALTETLKNYYTTGATDTLLTGKLSSVSIKGKFGVDTGGVSTATYTASPTATTFDLTSISIDCGEY
jgi:hypothetical protein